MDLQYLKEIYMQFERRLDVGSVALVLTLGASLCVPPQSSGQPTPPIGQQEAADQFEVSMVTLQTQNGPYDTQMIVTGKGIVVPLPGPAT